MSNDKLGLSGPAATVVWSKAFFAWQVTPRKALAHTHKPQHEGSGPIPALSANFADDLFAGRVREPLTVTPAKAARPPAPAALPLSPLRRQLVAEGGEMPSWRHEPLSLVVVEIIEEAPDTKTFRLAGETAMRFGYSPGDHVMVCLDIGGQRVRRAYSLSSSPSRPYILDLTVKRVPGGLASVWMCDHLGIGSRITVEGPRGRFTCLDRPTRRLLLIGAGSGITPLMSMCRWIADTAAEADVEMLLSFRTVADIIYRRELELLATRHPNIRIAITLTGDERELDGWQGRCGRVDEAMIAGLGTGLADCDAYLCGPEGFADAVQSSLEALGFDMRRLYRESFGPVRPARPAEVGPRHKVRFIRSGLAVEADEATTLLELAEAHGIELSYSCRSGYCGDCEVRCSGPVTFADAKGSSEHSNGGLVLACSCFARGDLDVEA